MSYKPMVRTGTDPKFYGNALAFETEQEALENARDLMSRWLLVVEYKAEKSDQEPNYKYIDGKTVPINQKNQTQEQQQK